MIGPGHNEYCKSNNLCAEGEGDCDVDSECQAGLKCGTDNCQGAAYSSNDDCCERGKLAMTFKFLRLVCNI